MKAKWWHSGWLKAGVIAVVLITGFYVQQNLAGALAWKKREKEVAAAGESLDAGALVPKPVPDDQNLGALPLFQLSYDSKGYLTTHALIAALEHVKNTEAPSDKGRGVEGALPYPGNWTKGEKLDRIQVRKKLLELCLEPPSSTATSLELLARLCPALVSLRAANLTRPACLLPQDPNPIPWRKSLTGITTQIQVAKVLAYEERLALDAGHADLALEDILLALKLSSGVEKEAHLVGGLVAVGMLAIQIETIRQGLAGHVWNDQELAKLEQALGKADHLATYQLDMRGEAINWVIPMADYLKDHRALLRDLLIGEYGINSRMSSSSGSWGSQLRERIWVEIVPVAVWLFPNGWLDRYKADMVGFFLHANLPMVDIPSHRAFAEKEGHAEAWINNLPASESWRNLLTATVDPMGHAIRKFAYGQVQVDEARLACRLERYRLVHGVYPESLAMLESLHGANPLDLLVGKPYLYRLNPDGSYLLYSLGWNQKDDGGDFTGKPREEALDWGWLNRPTTP